MKSNALYCLTSLLWLAFLLACSSAHGQNLVPNHSFEHFTALPEQDGDFSKLKDWKNPSGDNRDTYLHGTPDFFHFSGKGKAQIPKTSMGVIYPEDGEGLAGIITYNGQDEDLRDFREYVSIRLLRPLEPGREYAVRFYLSNGIQDQYGQYGTDNIGVFFSSHPPQQIENQPINEQPQLETHEALYSTTWREVRFSYIPDRPYQYMTVGNFRSDAQTAIREMGHATFSGKYAYYFLDNFSVTEISPAEDFPSPPAPEEETDELLATSEPAAEPYPVVTEKEPATVAVPDPIIPDEKPKPVPPAPAVAPPTLEGRDEAGREITDTTKEETIIHKLLTKGTVRINIHFAADSFKLVGLHYPDLDSVYAFLKAFPDKKIEVGGHTNGLCDDEFCFELSRKRARAVAAYLTGKEGIFSDQVTTRGYGKTQNITTNATLAGRRKNQRVEIRVLDP
ncbi:MAG: OmpA family protein [Phaeodactylibacter sp.]|nr:OmpA family protein [Phaeodactylibacter sp.]